MKEILDKHNKEQQEIIVENKILKSTVKALEGSMKHTMHTINDIERYSRQDQFVSSSTITLRKIQIKLLSRLVN